MAKVLAYEKIDVDLERCNKCKACVYECPLRLYFFDENNDLFLRRSTDEQCMECGHCVAVCPVNAIKLKNQKLEGVKEITEDLKIPSYEDLLTLFQTRRSIRQFKDEPIPKELWKKLVEAARYAPTGHNDQLIRFTIVRRPDLLKKFSDEITKNFVNLAKLFEDPKKRAQLNSFLSKKIITLIETFLPGLKYTLKGIEQGEEYWRWNGELFVIHAPKNTMTLTQDCTVAATNVMLAAKTLGLGTCSLGIATVAINQFKSVAKVIKLPKNHIVGYSLAVGFPNVKYYRIPARQPAKVNWL